MKPLALAQQLKTTNQNLASDRYCAVLFQQPAYVIITVVKDGKHQTDENGTEKLKFKMNLLRMLLSPLALWLLSDHSVQSWSWEPGCCCCGWVELLRGLVRFRGSPRLVLNETRQKMLDNCENSTETKIAVGKNKKTEKKSTSKWNTALSALARGT